MNKIRALYPSANITPIDYDPSATRVNQENRIKLMLAVAKERLNAPAEAKPLTAEEIAGGAPKGRCDRITINKQTARPEMHPGGRFLCLRTGGNHHFCFFR